MQVNYGLLTDRQGCPIAVTVHAGNTSDPAILIVVKHLRIVRGAGILPIVCLTIHRLCDKSQASRPDGYGGA